MRGRNPAVVSGMRAPTDTPGREEMPSHPDYEMREAAQSNGRDSREGAVADSYKTPVGADHDTIDPAEIRDRPLPPEQLADARYNEKYKEMLAEHKRQATPAVFTRDPGKRRYESLSPCLRLLLKKGYRQVIGDTIIDHPGISAQFNACVLETDDEAVTTELDKLLARAKEKGIRLDFWDADEMEAKRQRLKRKQMIDNARAVLNQAESDPELLEELQPDIVRLKLSTKASSFNDVLAENAKPSATA